MSIAGREGVLVSMLLYLANAGDCHDVNYGLDEVMDKRVGLVTTW
jgi:hypothetical protein